MVKKLNKLSAGKKDNAQLGATVKESAQHIWLAGLGAFAKAQEEGGKVFEALVKEGMSIQRRTQAGVEERISEATNKMANLATDIGGKATGQWDKLENIFEERVAKALNKLGVPSSKDVDALMVRIDALNKSVQKMSVKPVAKDAPKAAPKAVVKAVKAVVKSVKKPVVDVAAVAEKATATVKTAAKRVRKAVVAAV